MSDSLQPEQVAQPVNVPDSPGTMPPREAPCVPCQTDAAAVSDTQPTQEVQPHEYGEGG